MQEVRLRVGRGVVYTEPIGDKLPYGYMMNGKDMRMTKMKTESIAMATAAGLVIATVLGREQMRELASLTGTVQHQTSK